ncbi:MAG: type II toxin-antitoxin system mRNA interferase toxin, RelE/StbE family [Patescibacteria group bacterium]|nr:type II toxin-antitoxin system mRNA interferase toxin, RelE/StbE family [Patescibacteria group bacterium]MDE1988139.1 type II toxin-antitoxin system mRNA interferase toxin, RelE/StbE family [Patescibacteria group bacterium]MDE2218001.1 type II toxin-antitoxin system mRNA interferase toxin, RelE/StbE family [Patescibacteria group bacterium]
MEIIYSSKFSREYKKLPDPIKNKAEEKEIVFRQNPFDNRLRTHKLNGKFEDFWSFSVDYKYRIIFEISKGGKSFIFHSISDHRIYR